ncbi:MAG: diacylglycerol kinase [Salaquimonas sp.]|jgi:diacylglycerol kinase (ATP)|nr:diacylglycerol kinase [Salaquimonas sp.]
MQRIIAAFFNSLAGVRFGLVREAALREEMALLVLGLIAGPFLTLDPWRLAALWGVLLVLLAVEFLNTGLEKLADKVTRDSDDLVRIAKDCGSAAVLMMLVLSGGVWALALWERFFS